MKADYVFLIRNEKAASLRFLSVLLCVISAAFFLVQFGLNGRGRLLLIPASILAGGIAWNFVKPEGKKPIGYNVFLGIAGISWLFVPSLSLIAVPFIVLAIIENKAGAPLKVSFYEDQVEFLSLVKRNYAWSELSGVVLKDGLLTLDFKNNRLIQKEIETEVNEVDFKRYCLEKLVKRS